MPKMKSMTVAKNTLKESFNPYASIDLKEKMPSDMKAYMHQHSLPKLRFRDKLYLYHKEKPHLKKQSESVLDIRMKSSGLNTIVARSQKYSRMGSDEDPYERESPLQGSLFKEEESSSLQKLGESWTFKKQIDDGRSFSDFKIKIKGRMKERSNNGSAYNT